MQYNHVISYKDKKSKEHKRHHVTHDLELVKIIHGVKMWKHYLIGQKFLLMSDNISLKYLFDKKNLNTRQARWLAFSIEYYFEIRHLKGE
jgi:hypothetical protein